MSKKLFLLLLLLVIAGMLMTACMARKAPTKQPPPAKSPVATQPAQQPSTGNPGGVPQPQESGAGTLQVSFSAEPPKIEPGECTKLRWNVQGDHFGVVLDGEPVADQGEKEVCPPESTVFTLGVDTGEIVKRQVTVLVGDQPAPAAPGGPAEPPPAPGAPPAPGGPAAPPAAPGGAPSTPPSGGGPVTPKPATPAPAGKGGVTADIAPTDLFIDHQPHGTLWVRVTNNGHDTLINKHITIEFTGNRTPRATGMGTGGPVAFSPKEFTIGKLAPGQTQTINLGWKTDTSLYKYSITVVAKPKDFQDPNSGNNSYHEDLIPKTPLATATPIGLTVPTPGPAGPGGGMPATPAGASTPSLVLTPVQIATPDLALTDLKISGTHLIATITNKGPGDLSDTTISVACSWQATNNTTGAVTMSPGETKTVYHFSLGWNSSSDVDTGIEANTAEASYEFDCTLNWNDDPDTSDNSRSLSTSAAPPSP